ncbi:glycosyltransferase family 2 protein [Motilimonas sp. KMU-193]|uniref:glycosyltransferase family 2 protein n=1 Tax=Motilimonas sp. KMU-193 TaxID=3388668 RepID=UPI00396B3DAA
MINKISVITVVYNGRQDIQSTIESVANQDYPHIEFIVVDGGSSDGTVDILSSNNNVIDKWISEKDKGIYDAMNKGVKLATGDYVIFMNAGDLFFTPNAVSKCISTLCSSDVLYGNHWVIGARRVNGLQTAKAIEHLNKGMVCSHQSMFFRRSTLIDNPFSFDYGSAGDYELICRLYSKGFEFNRVDEVIAYYQAGGVSDVKRVKSLLFSLKAGSEHLPLNWKDYAYYTYRVLREIIVGIFYK